MIILKINALKPRNYKNKVWQFAFLLLHPLCIRQLVLSSTKNKLYSNSCQKMMFLNIPRVITRDRYTDRYTDRHTDRYTDAVITEGLLICMAALKMGYCALPFE